MRNLSTIALLGSVLVAASATSAETEAERRSRIFQETKVIVIGDLTVPAAEYKDDGDPTTLEIVYYTKKADGPARVTANGEVIFVRKGSNSQMSKLMMLAFEIRLARPEAGDVEEDDRNGAHTGST